MPAPVVQTRRIWLKVSSLNAEVSLTVPFRRRSTAYPRQSDTPPPRLGCHSYNRANMPATRMSLTAAEEIGVAGDRAATTSRGRTPSLFHDVIAAQVSQLPVAAFDFTCRGRVRGRSC